MFLLVININGNRRLNSILIDNIKLIANPYCFYNNITN